METEHGSAVTPAPLHLSTVDGYDRWSEFYDRDDIPLALLEEPVVDGVLGDVRGRAILDLGCGTGRQSLRMALRGARVTALDQSEGMLSQARTKDGAANVNWVSHNLDLPLPLGDAEFDWVVSCLALEHLTNLPTFFSECRRVCRPNGELLFTIMHPAMLLRGVQARYTEDSGRKVYPHSHAYQTSDYMNAAVASGLRLVEMRELAPADDHAEVSERAMKYHGWPLLLVLRFSPK
jgi:malonyl-CoA O-methyltransferase